MRYFTTLFLLLISLNVYGQSADLQFVVILNDGTNYDVKVQIRANPTFNLGTANLKLNFNNSDIINPTLLAVQNYSGSLYNDMTVTEPIPGITSLNIELFVPNFGTAVNTSWTDVATIRFTTQNPAGSSQLSFRDMNPPETNNPTIIFKDDETAQVTQGTFSPLDSSPLPVELTSFIASINQNTIKLEWQTATEINNFGFEIERKTGNGKLGYGSWNKIGFVEGNGNSNSQKSYSFSDKKLTGGSKFSYRLKQLDTDGTYEYSEEIEVEIIPTKFALYQNYPNPFNPATKIRYQLPRESKVTIMIYDMLGAEVMTLINESKEPGVYEVNLNISHLSSGTYIYRIVAANFVDTKKMILLK